MTAICIPIFVRTGIDLEAAIGEAEEALADLERSEKLLELRCDTAAPRQMLEAIDLASVPLIVTIRPTWEGGFSQKSDKERIALWEQAMEAGAEYIDVELAAWEKSNAIRESIEDLSQKTGTRLIISNHRFEGRVDIAERMHRLRAVKAAHTLKLAWKAESVVDALEALKLVRENRKIDGRPMVALAMGETGLLSRVLAKKFGAPFTFAVAKAGKESAPGQPTVRELLKRYRWQRQTADAPLFGVIGWPVGHSLSPLIHNAGFDALNLPGVYVPLAIAPDSTLEKEIHTLRTDFDLRGLSVTIPHKEHAMQFARSNGAKVDELSAHIGVVNTLFWDETGKLTAFNFDFAGAMDALAAAWGGAREAIAAKKVAVLGAGGAARAIVAGLSAYRARTTIFNRTFDKAEALARDFDQSAGPVEAKKWEELPAGVFDAVINCTPLGMHPKTNASPIDFDPNWTADTVVFDTIYNPLETKLIKLARKKGAKAVRGIEMFIGQAALQFKQFTGQDAPTDLFRQLLLKELQK